MAAITVTATQSVATFPGMLLDVRVLTGTAASPIGANASVVDGAGSITLAASVTTTQTGSVVYGGLLNVGSTPFTGNAEAGTTILDSVADSGNGAVYGACVTTSATGTPGSTLVGSTISSRGGAAVLEILPSGTITEDGSTPSPVSTTSATTLTTASFDPPAGCTLVALVSADADGSTVMTVSDSSSLTWTQQVVAQASGAAYCAVWTAQIPGIPPAPPAVLYSMRMMP